MKRLLIYLMLIMLMPVVGLAQSMTDDQVMAYVAKEHAAGKDNAKIVTSLMQRGVDIQQIRRVRDKYQKSMSQNTTKSLGSAKDPTGSSRLRTNNVKKYKSKSKNSKYSRNKRSNTYDEDDEDDMLDDYSAYSTYRVRGERAKGYTNTYDDNDEEYLEFENELGEMVPDTAAIIKQYYENKSSKKRKVFGRDIFNNEDLSFEPNMNIATPQDYRLGPGDAVIIDVYGASQKTEECTVSPDGEITIEGYGPIAVSGLTVAQANARVRSTLGRRYSSSSIKLTVGQTRTFMINVRGEVKMP